MLFCAHDDLLSEHFGENEEDKVRYNRINELISQQILKGTSNPPAPIVIPVVIHIITPPGTPIGQYNNLTDIEVMRGLQFLNSAFANYGSFFSPLGVNCEIEFCLAKRDPNNAPTLGITRTESNVVADLACQPFGTNYLYDRQLKNLVNWPCNEYMNIWLVTDLFGYGTNCSLAGYATFPGTPCEVDGIVQESRFWKSKDGIRVTAHEVGHYLGLLHTFSGGCINADCMIDGDKVCDTPPDQSAPFASCNRNSCSTDVPDRPDDNTNYMDYTICQPYHFTQGQKDRMIASLNTVRFSLLSSLGCTPVVNRDLGIIKVIEETYCADSFCCKIIVQNAGLENIDEFELSLKIDGTSRGAWIFKHNLKVGQIDTITLPCILLSNRFISGGSIGDKG